MDTNINNLIEQRWPTAQKQIAQIRKFGAKRLFDKTDGAGKAFTHPSKCVACGDEGIPYGIHLPGSGVLMPEETRRREISSAGVTEFTTHDNCGAFQLANPGVTDHNAAVQEWGKTEAEALGIPYRHIKASEMQREKEFHHGIVIYYDGTGRFNPTPQLPAGFVVSRRYFSGSDAILGLYAQIAFNHGFRDKFTRNSPLCIIVLGEASDSLFSVENLVSEVLPAVKSFNDRVVVDGFDATWYCAQAENLDPS